MADRRARPGLVFFLCFLAAIAEGYDLQSAGLTAPKFAPLFHLDPAILSWVFTANTLGLFLGAVAGGGLADRIGRRRVLIIAMLLFAVFSIVTALSPDTPELIGMRFLTGLGLGSALPNLIALTAETAPPGTASTRVTMLSAAMPLGGGVASLLLIVFPALDWRVIFWVGGLFPLLVGAAMLALLPESPVFRRDRPRVSPAAALTGDGRTLTTVLLWLSFVFTLIVLYIQLNWLPSLLVAKGFSKVQAVMVALFFTIGGVCGGLLLGPLSRMKTRRALYVVTWAGMAAGMVGLGLVGHDITAACAAGAVIGFFVNGGQFMLYGLAPVLYPDAARATGVGFAVGVGRLGSVLGPLYAGAVFALGHSAGTAFLAVVPVIALGLAAALPLLKPRP